jgi:WD40 repeat protein
LSLRIWDATSLNELAILKGHQDRITSLSWSPDSQWLASTSGSVMSPGKDNSIRLWDVASLTPGAVLVGHTNEVVSCAWQSDARHLVSASKDGTLIVWDTENTGRSPEPVLDAYVSNNGAMAALARKDNGLEIIDARTGAHLQTFHGHEDQIIACAWSPDDLIVATGSRDRTARLTPAIPSPVPSKTPIAHPSPNLIGECPVDRRK